MNIIFENVPPEERQNQCIGLAYDLAEQKLKDGTASSQMICLFLQEGLEKKKLELERMRQDIMLAESKKRQVDSATDATDLYDKAMQAFARYSGNNVIEEDDE